jgi:archaemetzincin
MPQNFQDLTKGERYAADSILQWLAPQRPDSISLITALTSKDIYIADKDRSGHIRQPEKKYAVWGILGLGYSPGRVNIVSDHRFRKTSSEKYPRRLRTIVIHEIGHNLGLPHCPTPHCIMNDANETIATVDASSPSLCPACSRRIQSIITH